MIPNQESLHQRETEEGEHRWIEGDLNEVPKNRGRFSLMGPKVYAVWEEV
jgi:hypothetical protein